MAIIFTEGFDLYASTTQMQRRGYNVPTASLQTGRFSGQCWRGDFNAASLIRALGGSYNNLSFGFAFLVSNLANASTGKSIISLYNGGGAGTVVCKLGADNAGKLIFGRTDFTTNKICESAAGVIVANTWAYIEFELVRATGSGGSVNVYCNGALVANLGSTNTGASSIDAYTFNSEGWTATAQYDDMYITDAATKLGEMRIETLVPTADTATKDWTRSTGADNYANVDDATMDDDTTYNSSSTAAQKDLFDMANLSSTPASVKAVVPILVARKDNAATRTARTNLKSGATTANGTTRNLGASYQLFEQIYETNPDTAAAWTGAEVNGMQLGYELVA